MSYRFSHIYINLRGPNGNVYALMALGNSIIREVEGSEVQEEFFKKVFTDRNEFFRVMEVDTTGFNWYELILKDYKDKIGWTYWSDSPLGLSDDLYELTDNPQRGQPQFF